MDIDSILDKLLGLFEKKIDYMMKMGEREMSLKEKTEERKLDFEYRKLEAQITTDRDKLTWEKEKLVTAIKGDYDLQLLKNTGLIDVEKTRGLNAKQQAEVEGAFKVTVAEKGYDAQVVAAKWGALGNILKDDKTVSAYNEETKTRTSSTPGELSQKVAGGLASELGINKTLTPAAGVAPTNAETAMNNARYIQALEAGPGGARAAEEAYNRLTPAEKVAVKGYAKTLTFGDKPGASILQTPVAPAAPVVVPISAVGADSSAAQGAVPKTPVEGGLLNSLSRGITEARANEKQIIAPPASGYGTPTSSNQLEFSNPFAGAVSVSPDGPSLILNRYGVKPPAPVVVDEEEKKKALRAAARLGGMFSR